MAKCEKCDKEFSSEESLEQHNQSKHLELYKGHKKGLSDNQKNKIRNWFILILVFLVIFGGIAYLDVTSETLPPTTIQGHVEVNPLSHILKEPMNIKVQKHMLEHSDGNGAPGIIINYNCEDYECESDLIENLESFAVKYPDNVYVAPFPKMDAKIALTKLNKIDILGYFDEQKIDNFING